MKTKPNKALTGYEIALQARQALVCTTSNKQPSKQPKISHKITGEKLTDNIPITENTETFKKGLDSETGYTCLQVNQPKRPRSTASIGTVLPNNYIAKLKATQVRWKTSSLPTEIASLCDKQNYYCLVVNRLNQVGLQKMLLLVDTAQKCANENTKGYFMKCLSKQRWEAQTKPMLDALIKLQTKTKATLQRLGISDADNYFYWFMKAFKQIPESQIHLALERATDKYFKQPRLKFVKEITKSLHPST